MPKVSDKEIDAALAGGGPGPAKASDAEIDRALSSPAPFSAPKNEEGFLSAAVNQPTLGPAGLDSFWVRTLLGLQDKPEEQQSLFKKQFPEGELKFVDVPRDVYFDPNTLYGTQQQPAGQRVTLFRRNTQEPFARLDAPSLEVNDIADFAGALPGIVGGGAAALLTRGASLPLQLGGQVLGSAGGETIKQLGQTLFDTQEEELGEQAQHVVTEGLLGGVGAAATVPFSGLLNVAKGAGLTGAKPGATEAVRAQQELALPPLLPSQITDQPLVRTIAQQAQRTSPQIGRHLAKQETAGVSALTKLTDPGSLSKLNVELDRAYQNETLRLQNLLTTSKLDTEAAGKSIQNGLRQWNKLASQSVTAKYETARAIEQPVFDISSVQNLAAEIRRGTSGVGRPQEISIPGGGTRTVLPDVRVSGEPSPALVSVIEDIQRLAPQVETVRRGASVSLSTDQIQALMKRLWDLKTPAPGVTPDLNQKLAGDLWHSLNGVLDNPVGGSSQFKQLWGDARTAARERFTQQDAMTALISVRDRAFSPFSLAQSLMQPGNHDAIKLTRKLLESRGLGAKWTDLVNGFQTNLMRDPYNIVSRLDKFDPETLGLLLTKDQQGSLRYIAEQFTKLKSAGITEVLAKQNDASAAMAELLERGSSSGINELAQLSGGPNTPLGQSLRAGVMDYLTRAVSTTKEGVSRVNHAKLDTMLKELSETTANSLLTAGDRKALANLDRYLAFVGKGGDVGASIQAAELGAGAVRLRSEALLSIVHNMGVGRFLTSDAGRYLLTGFANQRSNPVSLRFLGSAMAQMISNAQSQPKE